MSVQSATSTSSSSSAAPAAPLDPVFRDASNDIVLRSADGQSYPFRRLYLKAASAVFEDMFAAAGGADDDGPRKKAAGGLPIVQLADQGVDLERLLLFVHPHAVSPDLWKLEEIERCVAAALHLAVRLPPS